MWLSTTRVGKHEWPAIPSLAVLLLLLLRWANTATDSSEVVRASARCTLLPRCWTGRRVGGSIHSFYTEVRGGLVAAEVADN